MANGPLAATYNRVLWLSYTAHEVASLFPSLPVYPRTHQIWSSLHRGLESRSRTRKLCGSCLRLPSLVTFLPALPNIERH
ncbi:hypothetical protein EUGRSUZ_H00973 [Eucalyptus grandis]|uniref:Uncharacterized protein n=2 Tax=Eucalyptus grandis TaxID=71139 RepID=A0ACC3KCQ9_EUCGR|nr:hypothetical protein EUGRSUZ_H00973 [Eucalyptus grandis]